MPNKMIFIIALALCFAVNGWSLPDGFPQSNRQKKNLDIGWLYHSGQAAGAPQNIDYDAGGWEHINLPHTYKLTSINLDDCDDDQTQPTFHRDVSWYRRWLKIDATAGQQVFLEFEGAHQITDLWVNGRYVGQHAISGYTPFHFDVTDFVKPGEKNLVVLKLDNRKTDQVPPDGHKWDYVLFGGLYRDVYLVITDPLHITFPWEKRQAGVFITTPSVTKKDATISVRTTVRNDDQNARTATVVTRVIDAQNSVVMRLTNSATIPAGMDHTFMQTGGIDEDVHLWSFDDPYLYRVNSQILDEKRQIVDMVENPLGLRWFKLRPGVGFCLNGEPVELVGANRHQQFPYIGDAMPNNLHWNDAVKFKKAGMNIIRLAHYPHDNSFFDACDHLGILVCEEPPTWIEFGPAIWMDRLEESFRRTIRNHRNHPSVWGWGAGINHRGPVKRLQYAAKEEDPTRITMNNGTLWTGPQNSGVTDLYSVMDYRGAVVPDGEFLFAMEHSGSRDTRGLQRIVSRYKGDPERIGLTLWSAHDNYSFHKRGGKYPNLSRWSASCWDAFRIPKPAFYWYKSELTKEPMVHIPDDRAQTDSTVVVFSNAEQVELFHNGVSLGVREPERNERTKYLNSPAFEFPFTWKEGELTAKALQNGKVVAEHSVRKPGKAHHIELRIDEDCAPFYADGSSIFMAYAHVCDKNGTTVTSDSTAITFNIDGPGEIVGDASIGANPVLWERGVAPVLIRAGTEPGTITITAKGEGLKSGAATIRTQPWSDDVIAFHAKPIFEPLRLKVDLGAPDQHVEDEWTAWSQAEGRESERTFTAFNGARTRVHLAAAADTLKWTSSWGVPGDLSFLIEDGVSINADNQLTLTFVDLPKGKFQLKTWHHVLTTKKETVPALAIEVMAADAARTALDNFKPTFGTKIQVSGAGVGGRGDGGSNLGAAGFAKMTFEADGSTPVTITIKSPASKGSITLNGFDLIELVDKL